MTVVAHTRADLSDLRKPGPLGLVPTMGALHAGHAALIRQARESCESVLVTIFVNPLQFAPTEDLATYPRTFEQDLAVCEELGVDVVWAPGVTDVYPGGDASVRIDPGQLGTELEGVARPTHFAGVLTVVAKFFSLLRPSVAFFGEKDYQQLTLIRRMAGDLDLGVGVLGVPTVREPDGLALSSRNVHLDAEERIRARSLSRALFAGRDAAADGEPAVLAAAEKQLSDVVVDYLAVRADDLGPAPEHGSARLLVAARVGATRLIDNVAVTL